MPAGGTWTVQNKVRPGAYINFVSVPKGVGTIGARGTIAVGMPMTWGPTGQLIHLTGDELINGASLAKVGVTAMDTEASLPYRVAFAGCFNALLYRTDVGGVKATATIAEGVLSVSAKYAGTTGNKITIVTLKDKPEVGSTTVQVLLDNIVRESFIVKNIAELSDIESAFVDFTVSNTSEAIPATAGAALAGGTNGEVSKDTYATFWSLLDTKNFQCIAMYDTDPAVAPLLKDKVQIWREQRGKKVQAVLHDYAAADYEGIISVTQGFKTATETVDETMFPVWVASMTAGAEVNKSLTAAVVEGAVEIINPIAEDEIEDALTTGQFVLSYRQDGVVCVEKDINTLHTFTADKNYAFSKNRVVRCLDEVGNTTALIFNRNYAGKVDNDSVGRNLFKTELISMFDALAGIRAIQNFDGAKDITILPGASVDAVVVDLVVQPVDSMEKLYMTVNVNA
jgi:hypothetical protein